MIASGREMRGFEEHVAGGVGDAGVEAAHDAGQCDHAIGVGDDEECVVEPGVAAVEQLQRSRPRAHGARRPDP